jgi:toxin CcdB
MARFDVHARLGAPGLLLDCQADLLQHLTTRFVVPLLPRNTAPPPFGRLNPIFVVGEHEYVMVTQGAAAITARALGECVASLEMEQTAIMNALDMLIIGY